MLTPTDLPNWRIIGILMRNKFYLFVLSFILFLNSAIAGELQDSAKNYADETIKYSSTFHPETLSVDKIETPVKIGANADVSTYEKITLPEAIDYALTHNLDIKGNRINVDIARNKVKAAGRLKNPNLTSFYNTGKAATDNPDIIGLLFPIEIAKIGARKRLATSEMELTKGNIALAELNLRLDVRQAYVNLVSAKSNLRILNTQKKLLQELLYIAQKKYEAGAVPQMDVIHAKMTLNQLLIQVNTANTEVHVQRYNFNKLLNSVGYDANEDYLPVKSDFIDLLTPEPYGKMPAFKDVFDIAAQKRLDLKNAQKDVEVSQKNLVTVLRQRIPDLELGAGYMFVPQYYSTGSGLAQGVYVMGNIINIPLLYRYTPEINNAKLQVEQKQLAYESLKKKFFMDLHSSYDEFITAQDNLNYYNDILISETTRFLNMAKRSYQVGKTNITDFIFIEQSYRNIMMGYNYALANYYYAWIEVLRQVNDEELKLNE